jgi:hypothetical protein
VFVVNNTLGRAVGKLPDHSVLSAVVGDPEDLISPAFELNGTSPLVLNREALKIAQRPGSYGGFMEHAGRAANFLQAFAIGKASTDLVCDFLCISRGATAALPSYRDGSKPYRSRANHPAAPHSREQTDEG